MDAPPTPTPAPSRTWTVLSLIEWSQSHLQEHGFDEARLHAELLLAHVLGLVRLDLYLQFDRLLTPAELAAYRALFKRRLTHEPLQYILGETAFMGLTMFVERGVLIPRPETELLVELALQIINKKEGGGRAQVLDIGTGSGNIAVALGHHAPGAQIIGIDVSPEAIAVAARNVERHKLGNVGLQVLDVFSGLFAGRDLDLIVSNPPYISREQFTTLEPEVRDFEPRGALTDDGDGMVFHRRLAPLTLELLRSGGEVLFEIGFGQDTDVARLLTGCGYNAVRVTRDYAGIPRVVHGVKSKARGGTDTCVW
jgi:release factor glutamine methyltransferase